MKLTWTIKFLILGVLVASCGFGATPPEVPYVTGVTNADMGWPSDGWRVVERSPSGYEYDKGETDEVVDFTIFQADDDSWQIIGCVRWTTYPVYGGALNGRILYRWESTNFFATNWTEKGVFLTTSNMPAETQGTYNGGMIQAPHVVKDGDMYYMIYNSDNAHLMSSTNGLDWIHQTNSAGSYTLFDLNGGRDIALVDNRDNDGKWYATYCPKTTGWDSRGYTNAYRSASNILGPWSDEVPMVTQPYWQDVESPYIIRRSGWYYLFLQDWVFAQPSITNFFTAPPSTIMGSFQGNNDLETSEDNIYGVAPEFIHYADGQDYLVAYNVVVGDPLEGIQIRPMDWTSVFLQNSTNALTISEEGSDTFTLRLNSAPTATVEVAVSHLSGDTGITASPSNLTFTTVNWSNEQTVTVSVAADADFDDGTAIILCSTPSEGNLEVCVTGLDTDLYVQLSTNDLTILEESNDTFTVRLNNAPTTTVEVAVSHLSGDTGITALPTNLTFTTVNWSTEQTVTVSVADDADFDDGNAVILCSSLGVTNDEVSVIGVDTDIPLYMQLSTNALAILEESTDTFTVRLNDAPTTTVEVAVSHLSGDLGITASPTNLTFTTVNWSNEQSVTVSVAEDVDFYDSNAVFRCSSAGLPDSDVSVFGEDIDVNPALALPWSETFESTGENAGVVGALNSQHGWVADAGAVVITTNAQSGSQSLSITDAAASHVFDGAPDNILFTFWAQPVRGEEPSSFPADLSAVFFVNTNDQIVAYNSTNVSTLSGTTVSNGWNKFEVDCDYSSKLWNLTLNDTLVVTNFTFYSPLSAFQSLELASEEAMATLYIDEITVSADAPSAPDTDADGLPNWWELQYFGGVTNASPSDLSSNGINTIEETYIAGINPTNPAASFMLSNLQALSSESVLEWAGVSGRVYTVYWTSNLLSGFGSALTSGLPWTSGAFTDSTHSAEQKGFYKIEVEIE